MGLKEIMEFVKIEHALFSLPFVFIGALMAGEPSLAEYTWILIAAVGARGLAMSLNRIIDKEIDANNPRTTGRHLASGTMTVNTAYTLCVVFLGMLLIGAWQLNPLCLYLSPIPVIAFLVYPWLKRFTWACHLWLGVCLGLAPAGAWVAMTGEISSYDWWPELFLVSLSVMFWIAAFDIGYARMDVQSDKESGIHSMPADLGEKSAITWAVILTCSWIVMLSTIFQPLAIIAIGLANLWAITAVGKDMKTYQTNLFRISVSTGWLILLVQQLS